MLKADRVELAIPNLVAGETDSAGRPFRLLDLTTMLSNEIGPTSDQEVVEALLVLYEKKMVGLGRYIGATFVPLDSLEGPGFFYHDQFRCKALPGARRRQQELSLNNRSGVFISHIGEEKPIALGLQTLLERKLPGVPVFVSSDYKSI